MMGPQVGAAGDLEAEVHGATDSLLPGEYSWNGGSQR